MVGPGTDRDKSEIPFHFKYTSNDWGSEIKRFCGVYWFCSLGFINVKRVVGNRQLLNEYAWVKWIGTPSVNCY